MVCPLASSSFPFSVDLDAGVSIYCLTRQPSVVLIREGRSTECSDSDSESELIPIVSGFGVAAFVAWGGYLG